MVSLRTTRVDERAVEVWDVSQSEVSRGTPAGAVRGTRYFSDTQLCSVFLVLSHLCVSTLPVVPTKLDYKHCHLLP